MYFKRIDMQGFKSFADPVSIDFNEGITCIVGPNGSGKSNISDALRWVLGEQSPKTLRGGKMEEVIFAGTASRKSRGMAEVTLVIDNTTGILPIDYSEVAITRRMYRSGESEYAINKVPCRLKDIRELIMDTGIGVEGYSIIGQGRISEILSNKPDSRREIFEEAAGIVKYRSKKAETEKRLENTQNNLDRIDDIVTELESRLGGLKEDSEKAVEYLELRNRYKDIEINITLKNIENIELKNEYIKDDLAETAMLIDSQKEEKQALEEEAAKGRSRSLELDRMTEESRDKQMAQTEALNELTGRGRLQEERLASIDRDLVRIAEEEENLNQRLEREKANLAEFETSKKQLDEQLASAESVLAEKNRILSAANALAEKTAAAVDTHKSKIYEIHSSLTGRRSEINSLSGLCQTLTRRREQLLSDSGQDDSLHKELDEAQTSAADTRDRIKAEMEALAQKGKDARKAHEEAAARDLLLGKQLEDIRMALARISARKKIIEEMENAYEGYNYGVRFIMRAGLPGLHGVVADLITVPEGFETAMETALGAAVQNVVCADDTSAQKAVAKLKENNAGRLTFLPVSSIRARSVSRDARMEKDPGFKGYAVDLIEYDRAYDTIMEYLLGRVVIVDKLADAVRLSKSNRDGLRFVTLDGDVINASGAITGGASKQKTAGLLERKGEAQKLAEEMLRLEKEQKAASKEREELAASIQDAGAKVAALAQEYRDKELALNNSENEILRISGLLNEMGSTRSRWERELTSVKEEEANALAMIEELRKKAEDEEKLLAETETLAETAIAEHEAAKKSAEDAAEELTQARLTAGSAQNEKANLEQLLFRLNSTVREIQADLAQRSSSRQALLTQKTEIEKGDGDLPAKIEALEKEKAMTESILRQLLEEKGRLAVTLNEIEERRNAMSETLLNYQTSKHELEMKLEKNEAQIETYKERIWEEYEISYIQAMEFEKKDFSMPAAQKEGKAIRARMKELGDVNVGAIKQYETESERYQFLTTQREDVLGAIASLQEIIDDMDKNIRKSFKESFETIAANFQETFLALFGGGKAELRLEDESNPLDCGIEIVAQPPGKKLQNINLLSGGEKTMTAIALMFSILKARPTPFCILDEVEAALDEVNIYRFTDYLKTFPGVQFTLVTHQKATMEQADVLYGVTMPEQGISKVISLRAGDDFEL
ncbi:MAG: chromosome segregation protein SMC [Clostridiales bacterium]|nr:chromosome segregation protein SMC [Clostridiales bacterium]